MATMGFDIPPPSAAEYQQMLNFQRALEARDAAARAAAMGGGPPTGALPQGGYNGFQQVPSAGAAQPPPPAAAPPGTPGARLPPPNHSALLAEQQIEAGAAHRAAAPKTFTAEPPVAAPPPAAPAAGAARGALAGVARGVVNPTTAKIARIGKASVLGALPVAAAEGAYNASQEDLDKQYSDVTGYSRPDDAGFWSDLGVRGLNTAQGVGDAIIAAPGQMVDAVRGLGELPNKAWNAWNGVEPAKTKEQMQMERDARSAPSLPTEPPQFDIAGEPPSSGGALPRPPGGAGGAGGGASVSGSASSGGPGQPSAGALGQHTATIEAALNADSAMQAEATRQLTDANINIEKAFKQLQDANGVPDEIARGLSREEKGMLLMQFGLTMMSVGGRPGVNGLTAAGMGGQSALAGYNDILGQRRDRAKQVAEGKRQGALDTLTQGKWGYEQGAAGLKNASDARAKQLQATIDIAELGEKVRSNTATEAEMRRYHDLSARYQDRMSSAAMIRANKTGAGEDGSGDPFAAGLYKDWLGGEEDASGASAHLQNGLLEYDTLHDAPPAGWTRVKGPQGEGWMNDKQQFVPRAAAQ